MTGGAYSLADLLNLSRTLCSLLLVAILSSVICGQNGYQKRSSDLPPFALCTHMSSPPCAESPTTSQGES